MKIKRYINIVDNVIYFYKKKINKNVARYIPIKKIGVYFIDF